MRLPGWPADWTLEYCGYQAGRSVSLRQIAGPFAAWRHTHTVWPDGGNRCIIADEIQYELPGGRLGHVLGDPLVQRQLERVFRYRHRTIAQHLALKQRYFGSQPLHLAVSGSSGLIGTALCSFLRAAGNRVSSITRARSPGSDSPPAWVIPRGDGDQSPEDTIDAVIHLAGENIASGRWSAQKKNAIRLSRIEGTRSLCRQLAGLTTPPRVLLCASALGYYGDRSGESLTEDSARGSGFLAEVCQAWEEACQPARDAGIRVVHLRFGMVLSPAGGALKKMLLPFSLGLGGPLASGQQYLSWISLDDVLGSVSHILTDNSISGPINMVSPQAVSNAEFSYALGAALRRPAKIRLTANMLRLLFGQLADEVLLASNRAVPDKLLRSGYIFLHQNINAALHDLLGFP